MVIIIIALLVCIVDRITKLYIVEHLAEGLSIPIVPNVFHITHILNRGAAFGILDGQRWFFIVVVLILIGLIYIYRKKISQLPLLVRIGIGLLVGGALGNGYDRFLHGAVIDFFDFRIWPIFNVADICICLGVTIIIIYLWRGKEVECG